MKAVEEVNGRIAELKAERSQLEQVADNVDRHKSLTNQINALCWVVGEESQDGDFKTMQYPKGVR